MVHLQWMNRKFLEEVLKLCFIRESRVLIGCPGCQWVGLGAAICLSQRVSVPIGLKLGADWKILPGGKVDKNLNVKKMLKGKKH